MPDLTKPQKLLAAAGALPQPFAESDLIEAAWKGDPKAFGLRGKEAAHPCSNTVRAYLVGAKGLVTKGYLARVAPLTYRVTARGAAETGGARAPLREARRVDDSNGAAEILRCLRSPTFTRYQSGLTASITWPMALEFWGSVGTYLDRTRQRVETVGKAIGLAAGGLSVGARAVRADEAEALGRLHSYLLATFARKLKAVPS